MKKTLLATAIAGALGASAAAQAATVYNQDGTQLDIYGNIQIAYKSIETGSYDAAGRIEGADSQDELFDNGSTVGFSGQHVINPGLTGYFKAEFEHNADEEKIGNGLGNGDQAYLGLKGNFGDARLGSWDPLIDDWVQDPISNNEYFDNTDSTRDLGGLYGYNTAERVDREGDKFQYMSPVWAGLQFAIGTQYKGDAEFNGSDADFNVAGYEHRGGSNASFFGGLKYAVGAFSIAAVYDDLNNYKLQNTTTGDYSEAKAYGVTAQYTIDTLRLAAKVEDTDMKVNGESGDIMRYAVGARYGYALSDNFSGDLYGSYQYVDADENVAIATNRGAVDSAGNYAGDDNFNEFILGATYNISPAMYTFVEGAMYDRTHDVGNGVAVGAVYSF